MNQDSTNVGPRFSVVMTVYDNARELEENLSAYLEQDYHPGYEVIVVNESSTDDTDDVLTRYKAELADSKSAGISRLYTTFLPRPNRNISRQRMALTLGVKAAENEWVIFTDIHTKPSSTWLSELAEFCTGQTTLMLGYLRKGGDVRLQLFRDIRQASMLVEKAERRRADGHKGKWMRYWRGKYNFTVVKASLGHELLRHYECDVHGRHLLGNRLRTFFYNLFH